MTATWALVVGLALGAAALRLAGPLLLGRRRLPAKAEAVVELLGPALLAGLVATQLVAGSDELRLDERVVGVGAGALALRFSAPLTAAMVVAAAVTALVRAV